MNILNLYCGIGGNRKLWGEEHNVVAIDNNIEIVEIYHDLYPNDVVHITDAHEYLLNNVRGNFDFIWSSPPCPTHSELRRMITYTGQNEPAYPDMRLYQEIILLKYYSKKKCRWTVENVVPFYQPLLKPMVKLGRHYIWSNFYIRGKSFDNNETDITTISAKESRYGFNLDKIKIRGRKDRILRDLVNPEIGLYIFEESQKNKQPIFNFDY